MKILFCNITWMKYYKGIYPQVDETYNGGSYVADTGDAHEKYNFDAVNLIGLDDLPDGDYCLGFVETKSTTGTKQNQLHLEKIDGCDNLKDEDKVEDVLVIYCASHPYHKTTFVVGWYKNAVVYRNYRIQSFPSDQGDEYLQYYNAIAKKEDCVLMPVSTRIDMKKWKVPRKKDKAACGFGSANVWFATDDNQLCKDFVSRIVKQIDEYNGENWIDEYPNLNS